MRFNGTLWMRLCKSEILSESNLEKARKSRVLRDLSFIGSYTELYDRDVFVDNELSELVIASLDSYVIQDAKTYVLSEAKDEQILIINESHHRPEHRKFTTDLLSELYDHGYRYLALEAILSNQHSALTNYPLNKYNLGDTTIQSRGYPLMKACSGTYVKEPAFGNMIRKAIKLGYTIIGYEKNGKERELNQANNIAKIINSDASAKFLIHCGYGHIIESQTIKKDGQTDIRMAGYLKEITGINPMTIDQTSYYNLQDMSDYVSSRCGNQKPQLFINDSEVFKSYSIEEQDYWDMTIFYPTYELTEDRPSWLTSDTDMNVFTLISDKICIDYPIRIKLLESNDRLDAVPIDIIESKEPKVSYKLYGQVEKAKLVIDNVNGDRQIIELDKSPTNAYDKK